MQEFYQVQVLYYTKVDVGKCFLNAKCILMDTSVALSAWGLQRGDAPGYLFCTTVPNKALCVVRHEAWPRRGFVKHILDITQSSVECNGKDYLA